MIVKAVKQKSIIYQNQPLIKYVWQIIILLQHYVNQQIIAYKFNTKIFSLKFETT